jgi:hypothetical protein
MLASVRDAQARPVNIHGLFTAGVVEDEDITIGQQVTKRKTEGPHRQTKGAICPRLAIFRIAACW